MSIALIVIVFFGIRTAGGMDAVIANAKELPGYLSLTQGYNAATGEAGTYGFLSIVSTLAWGLGYFGMPHILLRFMAIRDEKELATSRRIASVWVVISMGIAVFIGVIGYSVSVAGRIPMLTTSSDSETVIIQLANLMSQHGFIFALFAGVILSGILAATMSTADSQLLAAASSVSQDLAQDFLGIKLSSRQQMRAARLTVLCIAAIAVVLAWNPNSSVFRVVSFAWAGFGAAFGPQMLLALFWRRSNKQGAIAGMVAGAAMVFIWKFLISPMGGWLSIYELLPAFLISLAANVAVSSATPEPSKAVTDIFDEVHRK
jgi:sodium/proline symporter